MIRRRGFLAGLAAALVLPKLAMPAIIRTPGLLMPISPVKFRIWAGEFSWGGLSMEFTTTYPPPRWPDSEELLMDRSGAHPLFMETGQFDWFEREVSDILKQGTFDGPIGKLFGCVASCSR